MRVVRSLLCALCAAALVQGAAGAGEWRPRPVCARAAAEKCDLQHQDYQSSVFSLNGIRIKYQYIEGIYFSLHCPPGVHLDEPGMPCFEPELRVPEVELTDCWPRAGSYSTALRALNVTALTPHKLAIQLQLNGDFSASVLTDVPNLRNLTIANHKLTAANLAVLPAGLESLELRDTGIGVVPSAALAHLPRLAELAVTDSLDSVLVEPVEAGGLVSLEVSSHGSRIGLSLPDSLKWLKIEYWAPGQPRPWASCAGLESLMVERGNVESLPDYWLAGCKRLRVLWVEYCRSLTTLAANALRGAGALDQVHLTWNALEALPAGLLEDARVLRMLDLSNNKLHTLPGDLFRLTRSLEVLLLTRNNLTSAALEALGAAASLDELKLDSNPALDACPGADNTQGLSPLSELTNLTVLSLIDTDTRRLCADWRWLARLRELNLAGTPITQITYADLQFNTTGNISVNLFESSLTRFLMTREEYERVGAASAQLILHLPTKLQCDCDLYWAAAALRHPRARVRQLGARCRGGAALSDVPLEDLQCPVPDRCPAGCACKRREDAAAPGPLLLVNCPGAGLTRVPRIDARAALHHAGIQPVTLHLHLADNRIDRLDPEDLPLELATLDLRDNWLGEIDAQAAEMLVARADRRVRLAGNRLECGCRAAVALATMRAHTDVFLDWANATCSDGTPLALAAPEPCEEETSTEINKVAEDSDGMSTGALVALVLVAVVVVIALGLALTWLSLRRRLWRKPPMRSPSILLVERRRPEPDEWAFDAFVSFAHADEAVAHELVERLEGGASPLRLCVHYRDWVPGGWIPAQIAASVRVSRRTVALVSEAFLRSKWARAEFREAYAAALEDTEPRLVLVLLEDPALLQLDTELRAFVGGNTYVRWGDPWFWQKLQDALPTRVALPAEAALTPAPAPHADPERTNDDNTIV